MSLEVSIEADTDIVAARQQGRMLAVGLGFSSSNATAVATAISELARNIVLYATRGQIIMNAVRHEDRSAVIITARDQGMGIADLSRACRTATRHRVAPASASLASCGSWTSSTSLQTSARAQS